MIKLVACLKRKAGLTLEEFDRHWHHPHGDPLTLSMEAVRHLVQSTRLGEADDWSDAGCDGVAEVWLDDVAAAGRLQDSPAGKEAQADQDRFMDTSNVAAFLTSEEAVDGQLGPGDAGGVKVMRFIRRLPQKTPEEFHRQWGAAEELGFGRSLGAVRHVRLRAVPESYSGEAPPIYDAVREIWFPDMDTLLKTRAKSAVAWETLMLGDCVDSAGSTTLVATQRRLR